MGFNGAGDEKLPKVLHEIAEEDKGPELTFKDFISLPAIDTKDVEVNPLYVIFDLKGVLVGIDYFRINHLLPSLFNIA